MSALYPKMLENIMQVHKAMLEESEPQGELLMWRGSAVELLKKLCIPASYYGKIFKFGRDTGSYALLRRGGNYTSSMWAVSPDAPNLEMWFNWNGQVKGAYEHEQEVKESTAVALQQMGHRIKLVEDDLNLLKRITTVMANQLGLVGEDDD